MSSALPFDPQATCDNCGRYGAYQVESEQLCADCYTLRGSCCPEFGGDDLWRKRESPAATPPPDPRPPSEP